MERVAGWLAAEGLTAHLVFLALSVGAAALALGGALLALVRRRRAGVLARLAAGGAALAGALATVLAASVVPGVPASAWGPDAATATALVGLSLGVSGLVFAWAAVEPRVACVASAAGAMASVGVLLQLLLVAAAPDPLDALGWETRRLSTMGAFGALQAMALAVVGPLVSLRPRGAVRVLSGVAFALALLAAVAALSLVGGGTLREAAIGFALLGALLVYAAAAAVRASPPPLARRGPGADPSALDRLALAVLAGQAGLRARVARAAGRLRRLAVRRDAVLLVAFVPVALASVALAFAGGDTARDAARVAVGGLAFTPALLVPFAFAPALGLVLGCPDLRARGLVGMGLTLVVVGLLVAQKEVGNTGVILGIAAVAFLAARGTLLHLVAAAFLAAVGVGLAFELQPLFPWIPFTVRERVLLWLGGAGYFRRGGHLLSADRVTYDLGGLWGLGIHERSSLDLHATVNSLDTDFPLAVVGHYGGFPWIAAYVVVFVALAIGLYDVARRQGRAGAALTAVWRLPTLAALATVPVMSTVVSVSGGLTHLTPFAGVPAAFLSYGAFFNAGLLGIVIAFLLAGSSDALAAGLRTAAGSAAAPRERAIPVARRPDPPDPWWRHPSWPGLRLASRRLAGRLRLASSDAGVLVLVAGLLTLGGVWLQVLYTRYSDRPVVHVHPTLDDSVRVRPVAPGTWEALAPAPPGWDGILREGRTYRLDAFELRYDRGALSVVGACFPWRVAESRGVRVGFEGWMQRALPGLSGPALGARLARRLGARREDANDLVLTEPAVWLRHLVVRWVAPGRFRVAAATPGARFVLYDEERRQVSAPRGGEALVPSGWTVALADEPRLHLRLDDVPDAAGGDGEVCLRAARRPFDVWALSRSRDTLVGGLDVLARAPVDRTIDFEFAEDLKRAAEARLVGLDRDGRLWVTPWDAASRAAWDPLTERRFRRIFRVRTRLVDGRPVERLHWVRAFYRDGSSRVRFDADPEAFAGGWQGDFLGLRDPFRFSRALPDTASRRASVITGELLDARGRTLARFDEAANRWVVEAPRSGALVGYGFPERGIYGGLLRVFRRLLSGRPVKAEDPGAELLERAMGREATRFGVDVRLTLDLELQRAVVDIVETECQAMRRLALERADLDWEPHGRALVFGPQGEILAAASCPSFVGADVDTVLRVAEEQRERPVEAPGLDAWQRTTTVGSTAKVGLVVAAARAPSEHFAPWGRDDLCIRAEDDPANERQGCFNERGSLASFRGEPIEPVRNYGGSYFGGVVTLRQMLVRSINTAASYIAGRVGLAELRGFYAQIGALSDYDLLPEIIGLDPRLSSDIDRWPGDPLVAWRARLGELPPSDAWRTTYDVRLALSGFSDFSLFHVGLAGAIAARDGRHFWPYLVAGVRDRATGRAVDVEPPHPLQVIPVRMARYVKDAMVQTARAGTAASLRRMVPRELWLELGGKTGTGETTRLQPVPDADAKHRRKPRTQDHKFFVGFWPASSRSPYVVVTGFEFVSHLDSRVAVRSFGAVAQVLDRLYGRHEQAGFVE